MSFSQFLHNISSLGTQINNFEITSEFLFCFFFFTLKSFEVYCEKSFWLILNVVEGRLINYFGISPEVGFALPLG